MIKLWLLFIFFACSLGCPHETCNPNFDLNQDGVVNGADLNLVKGDMLTSNSRSDFNCDDSVDSRDLFLFMNEWRS